MPGLALSVLNPPNRPKGKPSPAQLAQRKRFAAMARSGKWSTAGKAGTGGSVSKSKKKKGGVSSIKKGSSGSFANRLRARAGAGFMGGLKDAAMMAGGVAIGFVATDMTPKLIARFTTKEGGDWRSSDWVRKDTSRLMVKGATGLALYGVPRLLKMPKLAAVLLAGSATAVVADGLRVIGQKNNIPLLAGDDMVSDEMIAALSGDVDLEDLSGTYNINAEEYAAA